MNFLRIDSGKDRGSKDKEQCLGFNKESFYKLNKEEEKLFMGKMNDYKIFEGLKDEKNKEF